MKSAKFTYSKKQRFPTTPPAPPTFFPPMLLMIDR